MSDDRFAGMPPSTGWMTLPSPGRPSRFLAEGRPWDLGRIDWNLLVAPRVTRSLVCAHLWRGRLRNAWHALHDSDPDDPDDDGS